MSSCKISSTEPNTKTCVLISYATLLFKSSLVCSAWAIQTKTAFLRRNLCLTTTAGLTLRWFLSLPGEATWRLLLTNLRSTIVSRQTNQLQGSLLRSADGYWCCTTVWLSKSWLTQSYTRQPTDMLTKRFAISWPNPASLEIPKNHS